ncbi:hypothetical protein AXG93_4751s1130 [Marchantia polymorpha subsp. ruderalis]|uniref:Endoglucanase n=1 Tax=Marchantia polymorpha subsp. ruderalis TaxID=1480154 RepID=A0A176VE45_MARPO|nr:hypothetical protein AXG93_4751s1130 [Marchantia polymorpha subsp. ruderalis]
MGTYDIVDDEDDHPKRTSAWYVRTFVGVLLFAAAVTGAVVGIYMVAHPKDKKADDGGTPFTPSTPGSDPSPEDGPAPDFGPPGFAPTPIVNDNYTFGNALSLSLTFLNIQKSGKLPLDNPITWRSDSGTSDGSDVNLDLTGGLYDAGDHIKFGLPMAFTATMLAWSVLEYSPQMSAASPNQLPVAVDVIKWITDYLIKAHPDNDTFYMQPYDRGGLKLSSDVLSCLSPDLRPLEICSASLEVVITGATRLDLEAGVACGEQNRRDARFKISPKRDRARSGQFRLRLLLFSSRGVKRKDRCSEVRHLCVQVGDPQTDHDCWQRAEDVTIARPSYKLDSEHPGSDVAGESAAAMAAASLVFRQKGTAHEDQAYADLLLSHAVGLYDFASETQGTFSDTFPEMQRYYNSTGFQDELLWSATWLYHATGDQSYLDQVTGSQGELYGAWGKAPLWFSWDDKRAGVQVLLSRTQLLKPITNNNLQASKLLSYKTTADKLMCALLPNSPTASARRTAGGMIWVSQWSASVHTVNSAFLALVYSDYLEAGKSSLTCSGGNVYKPNQLRWFAYSQVDYLLGNNPMKMSYLVGYGTSYPKFLHHRGASIPSDGVKYSCKDGFQWLSSANPNPHVAYGALVGGPFFNESYSDARDNIQQNEASTYNSATMAGLVAGLSFTAEEGVPMTLLS